MLMRERNKKQKVKWEIFKTTSLVEVVRKATELGWAQNKVQVREHQIGIDLDGCSISEYSIEPYEDCGCANILKYSDYGRIEETLPLRTV